MTTVPRNGVAFWKMLAAVGWALVVSGITFYLVDMRSHITQERLDRELEGFRRVDDAIHQVIYDRIRENGDDLDDVRSRVDKLTGTKPEPAR